MLQMLEEFSSRTMEVLNHFDGMREILTNPQLPDDLPAARNAIEENSHLLQQLAPTPVEALEDEARQILERISGSPNPASK